MSRRGPAPIPTALQVLRGNPGRRPLTTRAPEIPVAAPEPPEELSAEVRAEWTDLVPLLAEYGLVTGLDRAALVMYCELRVTWRELDRVVKREGVVITRRAGPGVHPAFKAAMETLTQLRLLGAELGLSPSARSRLRVPGPPPQPPSKVDAFRAKHGG